MNVYILVLFVCLTANIAKANTNSTCICTTVPCPHENVNTVIMGNGYATIEYIYHMHDIICHARSACVHACGTRVAQCARIEFAAADPA